MKKLNLAIIGQGRSGKDIHGVFYRSENNTHFVVKYVVEKDEYRRNLAKKLYEGCEVLSDYTELFGKKDIDLVVNASYSYMHYSVSKDLLEHGFNVLCEKPFGRNRAESDDLIKTAKDNGVYVMAFQQTFYAPIYLETKKIIDSGILGKVEQISIRYNNLSRRWDWQTLLKTLGGNCYNTGPHPIGMALGFIDFDENARIAYSKLDNTEAFAGDADSYAKVIITAPNKPVLDIEINNTDAYSSNVIKVQGSRGTYVCNHGGYKYKYYVPSENTERKPIETFLEDENKNPIYCYEKLNYHEVEGTFNGTAFDVGTRDIYNELYYKLTENKQMTITPENCSKVVEIINAIHANNPLELKF